MLKNGKTFAVLLLTLASIISVCLFGCADGSSSGADTGDEEKQIITVTGDYLIIYESTANKSANKLRKEIYNICGVTPEIKTGDKSTPQAYEIFLGDTGRDESTAFISSLEQYTYGVKISVTDSTTKIFIGGAKSDYLGLALQLFIDEYLPSDGSKDLIKTEDTIMLNTEDKKYDEMLAAEPIQWQGNNIYVQNGGYARMCELPDKSLACVYSAGNQILFSTSKDSAQTWSQPIKVTESLLLPNGQKMAISNANIVVMKNGDYMVAFREHTPGENYTEFYSSIRYCISSDGGNTWSDQKIVVENTYKGNLFTGFWEPHMLYVKDGKLAMYYANDCIGGDIEGYPYVKSQTYQHIMVHIYDEQTQSFGEAMIASNGEKHDSRDGMPVVCELSDGSYAMVIESSVMRSRYSFIIQMLLSEDGINWSDPITVWTPSQRDNYSGAPFIVCLDDGRVAISFQATEGSGSTIAENAVHNSAMNVIVSKAPITYSSLGLVSRKSFDKVNINPIQTTTNHPFSVWPAMLCYNGELFCIAQCGYNSSTTATISTGLYIRIGKIKQMQ